VELTEDAQKDGAKLVTGGEQFGQGYHLEPTALVGASKDSRVYQEEIFAPICSIYPFDEEEEVSQTFLPIIRWC
jgi:succinate-semialdehyde dehydrogenase/glutarate-semialdehyde dehydrogenase